MNENSIQKAVFAHLRQRGAPGVFAFHPKNGGIHQRGRARGINAGLGVVSGVPDVIVVKPVTTGALLFGQVYALELKTAIGKASDNQRDTLQAMKTAGAIVGVAYGLDAAIAWLESHKLLLGKAA